jgi:oxygen-independent coproporphyrinogen-3 oxidase
MKKENSLYLHIPFCTKKCFYCDFYSLEKSGLKDEFTDLLCREIRLTIAELNEKPVIDTIFFGGGTPSLLTTEQFRKIFATIHELCIVTPDAEITVECNPGTIDRQYLIGIKKLGVNRLSFGVQSFVESELEFLQRIHSPEEAENAVIYAREAGFDNISIDLMFAVPGQTLESLEYSIEKAIALGTDHISAYSLIYEPGTPLFKELKMGRINPTDEDTDYMFFRLVSEKFISAGYEHYEISNYAQKGKKCKHNFKYWYGGEYFGFGPSAHGFIRGRRYWDFRNLNKYIELLSNNILPVENSEIPEKKERISETIMLGLRAEGIDKGNFKADFGFNITEASFQLINDLKKRGLIAENANNISLTEEGYFLCDEISVSFTNLVDKFISVSKEL